MQKQYVCYNLPAESLSCIRSTIDYVKLLNILEPIIIGIKLCKIYYFYVLRVLKLQF